MQHGSDGPYGCTAGMHRSTITPYAFVSGASAEMITCEHGRSIELVSSAAVAGGIE